MKTKSVFQTINPTQNRLNFSPIRMLNPESLTRILDGFRQGHLRPAAILWDAIESRDDILKGVVERRKKNAARLPWEIVQTEDSEESRQQSEFLRYFYDHLTCCNACDLNERGGFALLLKQMMDCVGKKYAVHEIVYGEESTDENGRPQISAEFRFVPLWFFENRTGQLRFLPSDTGENGQALEPGSWLVSVGDGLMEACSIAYLFKHLPLRDWLIYSERNGMPGVKGVTDAAPGSLQWDLAREAVEAFGAEFSTLMAKGSNIEAIDLSSKGPLPYPGLIERMDRAMIALWTGSDFFHGAGGTMENYGEERGLLEEADAALLADTLNTQVSRFILAHVFGTDSPKAYLKIKSLPQNQLNLYERLLKMGLEISKQDLREQFGLATPAEGEDVLQYHH